MDAKREKKISKSLSYWLRHKPDDIGIKLDKNGWVDVHELMERAKHKLLFDFNELKHVVDNNSKQRFSIVKNCVKESCTEDCNAFNTCFEDEDFELSDDFCHIRIRANQGHSIKDKDGNSLVDLELEEVVPPQILFHGAPVGVIDAIMKTGLKKMKRHHVHLSVDKETAAIVGGRRGEFEILSVEAMKLRADGHKIYISENGVYLVDEVPPEYIKRQDEK